MTLDRAELEVAWHVTRWLTLGGVRYWRDRFPVIGQPQKDVLDVLNFKAFLGDPSLAPIESISKEIRLIEEVTK